MRTITKRLRIVLFLVFAIGMAIPILVSSDHDLRVQSAYPEVTCKFNTGCGCNADPLSASFQTSHCYNTCSDPYDCTPIGLPTCEPSLQCTLPVTCISKGVCGCGGNPFAMRMFSQRCLHDCENWRSCEVVSEWCETTVDCSESTACFQYFGCGTCGDGEYRNELVHIYYCRGNPDDPGICESPWSCGQPTEQCTAPQHCALPVSCSWNEGCAACDGEHPEGGYTHVSYFRCPENYNCADNPSRSSSGCEPVPGAGSCVPLSSCPQGCHPSTCDLICDWRVGGCPGGCGAIDNCNGVSCQTDCGSGPGGPTPVPTPTPSNGTAMIRAHIIPSTASTCAEVEASTNYLAETIAITPDGTPAGTQSVTGGSYANWSVAGNNTYTILDTVPSGYVLRLACWNGGAAPAISGQGISALISGGQTVTWELGYSLGTPWVQTQGGDVYVQTVLRSYIPSAAVPRYFSLDGTGGSAGLVQYGTSYDLDSGIALGEGYTSSRGWLVNDTNLQTNYYAVMYKRFGSPTTVDYAPGTTLAASPTSRVTPYYMTGDLTVDGTDWSVTAGQTIIFLVGENNNTNK